MKKKNVNNLATHNTLKESIGKTVKIYLKDIEKVNPGSYQNFFNTKEPFKAEIVNLTSYHLVFRRLDVEPERNFGFGMICLNDISSYEIY